MGCEWKWEEEPGSHSNLVHYMARLKTSKIIKLQDERLIVGWKALVMDERVRMI